MFAKTLKIPDKQKNVVLLPCKCTPFEVQKDYIYRVKGLHLNSKRTPFEKPIYNPLIFNAFKNRDSLHFYQYFNTLHSIFNTLTPNSQCILIRFKMHLTHFFNAIILDSKCISPIFSMHYFQILKAYHSPPYGGGAGGGAFRGFVGLLSLTTLS